MDIILLDFYLRLFAIIANLFPGLLIVNVKDFIKYSVLKELNREMEVEAIRLFDEYYSQYSHTKNFTPQDYIQLIYKALTEISSKIPSKQKFQILLRVLFFERLLLKYLPKESEKSFLNIIHILCEVFLINQSEFKNCRAFILQKLYQLEDLNNLLIVSDKKQESFAAPFLKRDNLNGQIFFLNIKSFNTILFLYKGPHSLIFNNQGVFSESIYMFSKGSVIKGENLEPIYYNQVERSFLVHLKVDLQITTKNLAYSYSKSQNGIHKLNITVESEQLIGIVGRSGSGKSTLMNILSGKMKPHEGSVEINGWNLHLEKEKLDGIIGYVPQDDLLLGELTVFTNLFLNAKLCFKNLPETLLKQKVENLLTDLGIYEVKDLKVGTALNRFISGGQRKKLNIALELIREPWILFVDEPTSGLSSSDSEEIMHFLADQTTKSRIVVVNIHQPSSDIFKMFDKILVLDKEGYPVYFGNPLNAIPYFNDYFQRILVNADACSVCENINPETIFKILEQKKTNDFGEYTNERKIPPQEWHEHFLSKNINHNSDKKAASLPEVYFKKPGPLKQFLIFSERNLLSKFSNLQYIGLAVFISPVLALVLSLLCRYFDSTESTEYVFGLNENIPSYLFMSVIVAIFLGLIMSSEEIIRDRKILMRESFLKLSKRSYIHSKIAFVFAISALQMILFVIIGNTILEIRNMTFNFWIILFSTACFANLVGLLISASLNSVISIYILVPLIIVPQMLLSGVVVNFDKLNNAVASREFVPFIGDVTASRWAYEALLVNQFRDNEYQKLFFDTEKLESEIKFNLLFRVPEMKKSIATLSEKMNEDLDSERFIKNEISQINATRFSIFFDPSYTSITLLDNHLNAFKAFLSKELDILSNRKDSITSNLVTKLGGVDSFLAFKKLHYNTRVADLILKRKELEPYVISNSRIYNQFEPVYQIPQSKTGRSHFLSSTKNLGSMIVNTGIFNVVVLWIMSAIVYLILIFLIKFK